jgi:dephospho-CoA kinase
VMRGSETDKISYEEFISNEQREMENTDPNKQNIGKCIQLADYIFTNDWSLEDLHKQIEKVLEQLKI